MELNLSWSDIKSFSITRNVPLQYFIANNSYYLFASDWPMVITAQIAMDGSQASDQSDFETNYKPTANSSPQTVVKPKTFIDNTISGSFNGAGQTIQISTKGCSTAQYGTVDTSPNGTSWVGTIITELSYDNGTTWFPIPTADTDPNTNLLMLNWGNAVINEFNNDPWQVNVSGSTLFRLRVVNYTSGSLSVVMVSSAASSVTLVPSSDRWNSGNISSLNGLLNGPSSGCSSCAIAIAGTWVGTLTFQATIDNVNFFNVSAFNISTGIQSTTTTSNGNFLVPCGGFNLVQVVMTSYTSGTATVTFDASSGSNTGTFPINVLDLGTYNTSLPILNPNQRNDLQVNQFSELAIQFRNKYKNITGNSTTVVKGSSGRLHSICINNNTTGGTITVYDNTTASGTKIMTMTIGTPSGGLLSNSGMPGPINVGAIGAEFGTGLTIVTVGSTSNDITVFYQ
jgi:hypothetical protein